MKRTFNPAHAIIRCGNQEFPTGPYQHKDSPVVVWHEKILVDDEFLFGTPESETRRECCKQAQAQIPSTWYLLGGQ